MAVLPILIAPHPTLKAKAKPVKDVTDELRALLDDMLETMYDAPGIGLAAPQVGILKRIFVMDCSEKDQISKPYICINPEITWVSDHKSNYEEGCLSIPDFYGEIMRPSEIKMNCLNENGEFLEYHFEGLKATCAQHEIDHLNGVLFIDYLGRVRRQIITTKMKKIKKQIVLNQGNV